MVLHTVNNIRTSNEYVGGGIMAKKKTWWDNNKEYVAKKLITEWKIDQKVAENVCGVEL